ncbi:hypothetical protein N9L92_04200 [Saprospiraceae bacterium]|nr:hypothetical protein [Saprospiraceae bacterium]
MLRSLKAVIVATICSGLIFMVLTVIARYLYPRPDNIARDDKAALEAFIRDQPMGEQLFLSATFILCGFLGAYIAGRLSDLFRLWIGMIGGGFIFMVCVSVFLYVPIQKSHAAITILLVMLFIFLGAYAGSRTKLKA